MAAEKKTFEEKLRERESRILDRLTELDKEEELM